jgi:hypothetical protein
MKVRPILPPNARPDDVPPDLQTALLKRLRAYWQPRGRAMAIISRAALAREVDVLLRERGAALSMRSRAWLIHSAADALRDLRRLWNLHDPQNPLQTASGAAWESELDLLNIDVGALFARRSLPDGSAVVYGRNPSAGTRLLMVAPAPSWSLDDLAPSGSSAWLRAVVEARQSALIVSKDADAARHLALLLAESGLGGDRLAVVSESRTTPHLDLKPGDSVRDLLVAFAVDRVWFEDFDARAYANAGQVAAVYAPVQASALLHGWTRVIRGGALMFDKLVELQTLGERSTITEIAEVESGVPRSIWVLGEELPVHPRSAVPPGDDPLSTIADDAYSLFVDAFGRGVIERPGVGASACLLSNAAMLIRDADDHLPEHAAGAALTSGTHGQLWMHRCAGEVKNAYLMHHLPAQTPPLSDEIAERLRRGERVLVCGASGLHRAALIDGALRKLVAMGGRCILADAPDELRAAVWSGAVAHVRLTPALWRLLAAGGRGAGVLVEWDVRSGLFGRLDALLRSWVDADTRRFDAVYRLARLADRRVVLAQTR